MSTQASPPSVSVGAATPVAANDESLVLFPAVPPPMMETVVEQTATLKFIFATLPFDRLPVLPELVKIIIEYAVCIEYRTTNVHEQTPKPVYDLVDTTTTTVTARLNPTPTPPPAPVVLFEGVLQVQQGRTSKLGPLRYVIVYPEWIDWYRSCRATTGRVRPIGPDVQSGVLGRITTADLAIQRVPLEYDSSSRVESMSVTVVYKTPPPHKQARCPPGTIETSPVTRMVCHSQLLSITTNFVTAVSKTVQRWRASHPEDQPPPPPPSPSAIPPVTRTGAEPPNPS